MGQSGEFIFKTIAEAEVGKHGTKHPQYSMFYLEIKESLINVLSI